MILILGGAYQGKLQWAKAHYGLTEDMLCDLACGEPVPGKRCYYHLEDYTRRVQTPELLPMWENAVLIAREIGSGVVPLSAQERAWRERHGAFLQQLAARADVVARIFCGLPEFLKQSQP